MENEINTQMIAMDHNFNVTNYCPCKQDIDSLCINKWNLYCNDDTTTNPSIFTNASCNIYCDQQENCINKFNFYCNGECNDILINNNFATNMVSINCNNGHYNNMSTYNLGVFIIISICNN